MAANPFPYSGDNKRYHTFPYALRRRYGRRMAKIPINAGFGCPNLDGRCGVGGCSYCSSTGSAEFGGNALLSPAEQFLQGMRQAEEKHPGCGYLAYFQARTNTYAPLERLREVYEPVLALPQVEGIHIATRADCLPEEVLCYLADIAARCPLTVELGLQTIHEPTARAINRCHSYDAFLEGYRALRERGIDVCIHLINGLPGEDADMMRQTAAEIGLLRPQGVKIHLLHLLRGTPLAAQYTQKPFPLLTQEAYVSTVCDQLELLPPETVIQRLTGDGDRRLLIGPLWSLHKRQVLNAIDAELLRRGSMQGSRFVP